MSRPVVGVLSKTVALIPMVFVLLGIAGCGVSGSSASDGVGGGTTSKKRKATKNADTPLLD